ncbi:2-hydroxy-acid oxidase [Mesorhizobium sp. LNJC380A00]|nr:2-hydroxy-acid oxidase [Mesorhizobium sp. LNJC394B00]ESY39195.1 2-hydroxy-acid oxidase [Mesorhizobium sp. LNJC380A00]
MPWSTGGLLNSVTTQHNVLNTAAGWQMPSDLANEFLCLADFEPAARDRLPHAVYEFIAGAAGDEITMRDNVGAFDLLRIRPRVLRDVSKIDTSITLFGERLSHPIFLAPTAFQRMSHPEGEVAAARGAGEAGAIFTLGTSGTATIEECVATSPVPIWFLLYWQSDRCFNRDLVAQVAAGGAKAICVTVDMPTLGDRRRQMRAGFKIPDALTTPYFNDRNTGLFKIGGSPKRAILTWPDVEWLRSLTALPIVLKGILDPEDAELAISSGADAIVVSNHGARNLDTLPATIDALPAVAERVAGRIPIIIDGGIRRGTDVLKSIALGATAVMIGRPYVYALALGGSDGVRHCVDLLRREFETAMALTGRTSIGEIDRSLIW